MKRELLRSTLVSACALTTTLYAATVTGEIVDARGRQPIPARLYVQADDGRWFFAEAGSSAGSAIRYEKRNRINTNAVEMHVTLPAQPFRLELPPGGYAFTVERGTEYRPLVRRLEFGTGPMQLRLPLRRWINMADVPGEPLRPRREEVDFIVRSVRQEIARTSGVLSVEILAEYRQALAIYEDIARRAR